MIDLQNYTQLLTGYTLSLDNSVDSRVFALAIECPIAGTLDRITPRMAANTGTVTNIGRVTAYPDNGNNRPNLSSPLSDTVTFTPVGGYNSQTIIFSTTFSVQKGQKIWFVFSNADPSPATNYYSMGTGLEIAGSKRNVIYTSDGGSSWGYAQWSGNTLSVRIDALWCGAPVCRLTNSGNHPTAIYRTADYVGRVGILFRVFKPFRPMYTGVSVCRIGTVAAMVGLEIYDGATKLLSTLGVNASAATTNVNAASTYNMSFLKQNAVLLPNKEYRLVALLTDVAGDASNYVKTKRYTQSIVPPTDNTRNTSIMIGNCYSTVPTITSVSDWTDTRTGVEIPTHMLWGRTSIGYPNIEETH